MSRREGRIEGEAERRPRREPAGGSETRRSTATPPCRRLGAQALGTELWQSRYGGGDNLGLGNADENSQFKAVLVRLVCTSNGSSEVSLVSQHGRRRPWEPVIIRQCSSTKYLSAGSDYITPAELRAVELQPASSGYPCAAEVLSNQELTHGAPAPSWMGALAVSLSAAKPSSLFRRLHRRQQ